MMRPTRFLSLFWLSIMLAGCGSLREEVTPGQLTSQPIKLVVQCFIAPQDTLLTAKVTRSRPVLDNTTIPVEITDAVVTLSDGRDSVALTYRPDELWYAAPAQAFRIRERTTYTLTVRTPDGKRATAVTRVPAAIPLDTVRVDSGDVPRHYRVMGNWRDPAQTFYRVKGTVRGIPPNAPPWMPYGLPEPILFTVGNNSLGLVASRPQPGRLSITASLDSAFKKPYRSTLVTLDLLHVDAAYYQYHLALDRQLKADADPFAEAVVIVTNIGGGLGCFGSYNLSTASVVVR